MKILILNASPKQKGGASRFFARLLMLLLRPLDVTLCDARDSRDYEAALSLLPRMQAVVLSTPLYVDGIPSHLLPFLSAAEALLKNKETSSMRLYVLSNSGFVEGKQNALHLAMYEAFCLRAHITYGGGLGLGGGVMLHVLFLLLPVFVLLSLLFLLLSGPLTGTPVSFSELLSSCTGPLVILFLLGGMIVSLIRLALTIRRQKETKNRYMRPLIPSFLFLIVSDLFMILAALLRGTPPHRLFRKP